MKQNQQKGRLALFLCVIALTLILDQASKVWIEQNFFLLESRVIIPGLFNLTFLSNNGAAFSLLAGEPTLWRQVLFVLLPAVALFFIAVAQKSYAAYSGVYSIALGLIAGGATGNLLDRLRLGYVVDFIDMYVENFHWPAFNVADAAITIGVLLFLVKNLIIDRGDVTQTNGIRKRRARK